MLPKDVSYCDSASDCIAGADAVVIVTEWNEFRALTAAQFIAGMRGHVLVDLRNIYDAEQMRAAGLAYSSIGR
jgi:UDPglucose 6-dehydrogenase